VNTDYITFDLQPEGSEAHVKVTVSVSYPEGVQINLSDSKSRSAAALYIMAMPSLIRN